MSNLVIVAIPEEDDRVWKVSSEKVPHLTLLFLGEVDEVSNLDQIIQFVGHAANTTLKRFYLPVDRRGELGDDQADVLFFKKGRHDYKTIRDFRATLLQDDNIKTAYDSATQFEGPWQPHLTLGYPASPAKVESPERTEKFYEVSFNKIAVWTGESEGMEYLLKDYWDEHEALEAVPMDVAMSELQHFGTKGMKWGVRKARDAGFRVAPHAPYSAQVVRSHVGGEARRATKKELPGIKAKHPEYSKRADRIKKPLSNEAKAYRADVKVAYLKNLETAANSMTNASGTRQFTTTKQFTLKEKGAPNTSKYNWSVKSRDITHADDDIEFDVRIVTEDGYIVDFKLDGDEADSMAQTVDLGSDYILEHFGVKGMKWGFSKVKAGAKATSTFVKDANFESRTEAKPSSGGSSKATKMVADSARAPFKRTDLPEVKARHGDYGKLTNRAKKPFSKEARAYRKDAKETYIKRLETTANSMKNASGTREYTIRERGIELPAQGGNLPRSKFTWAVSSREAKHAAGDPDLTFELIMDDGYIIDLKPVEVEDSMAQMADLGSEFILEHFGIKGMKWGVRKSSPDAVATSATSRVPHGNRRQTKIDVEGGQNHPAHADAIKVAEARGKLKKSGTAALSNQELQEVSKRLELELKVSQLTSSRGQKFLVRQLEQQGQMGVQTGVRKAAPKVIKKVGKGAATTAATVALML